MELKLDSNLYPTLDDFLADADLIFKNCRQYNPEASTYVKNANRLEKYMKERGQSTVTVVQKQDGCLAGRRGTHGLLADFPISCVLAFFSQGMAGMICGRVFNETSCEWLGPRHHQSELSGLTGSVPLFLSDSFASEATLDIERLLRAQLGERVRPASCAPRPERARRRSGRSGRVRRGAGPIFRRAARWISSLVLFSFALALCL